ncbi:MAG: aminopeptidase P family protein [Proteobacteria bacterium]|nr:aminopeptidase P family protein [Pseudomonadota bacterium]
MAIEPRILNEPRVRAMMERKGLDLLIVRGPENSRYMSGFFHNGGTLGYRPFVVFYFRDPAKEPALVVPAVDLHLAMDSSWIKDCRGYAMAEFFTDLDVHFYEDFFDAAKAVLAERGVENLTIGTEGEQLTEGFRKRLDELLEGNRIVDIAREMELVRMVKSKEEIRRLKQATRWTVEAHRAFREAIRPGATDRDLHKAAVARMVALGAEGAKFINVGTGPTSYAAHSPFPVGHKLKPGDFVKVDMGAFCLGYGGDFVRSYYLGHCSQRQKDIWKWLNEVQMELGMSIKVGETGGDVFRRGYKAISRHLDRFPREFVGHGIGLASHEEPRMNEVNRVVVEPGTVYCIEYSYYSEGVRFHTEETFLITDKGVECWTADCPRELIVPI